MNPGDRYQLLEKVAAGSFATVYRAQDLELKREVAVKQIHEQFLGDPKQLDRYWGEAQLLASLQHPNIVTIYDIVRNKGWLIMELMQANLADRQAGRPMDLVSLRTVLAHSLRALKFLHEHGIVHGDIKPSNLMIDRRKRIKLGDFGLARRVSDEDGSLVKGTTKYMAPEVVSDEFGDVGPASDLYSLGFAAYELMCGDHFESLFPGLNAHGRDKQLAWIMWHAARDRRLPPVARVLEGVPDDLAQVIQKLATKDPALRYASADAALADLNVDLRVIKADPETTETPVQGAAAKRRRLIIITAFACSMGMSLFLLLSGDKDTSKPNAKSGLIRTIRLAERELVIEDEATSNPEVVKLGNTPSLFLKNTKKKILLEEVEPDDRVQIIQKNGNIEFVLFRPVETNGRIIRIDEHDKSLIVHTDTGAERRDIPMQVGPQTKVVLNQDPIAFHELKEEDRVNVLHLPDVQDENRQVVLTLRARRTIRATGFVRSVDVKGQKLSFDVRQGATTKLLQLPFSKACEITLPNGTQTEAKELKSEDLQASDRISVEFDTEVTKIVAIRNKTLSGVIQAVDVEQSMIVVQTSDKKQHALKLTPTTEVDIASEVAQLEDIREYDETRVSYEESDDGSGLKAIAIDVTRPFKHDRRVILIGVGQNDDKSVAQAGYIRNDVQLLAESLQNRYCVAPERVTLLKDAERGQIQQAVEKALESVDAATQVILVFEGQAYEAGAEYFLASRDFRLAMPTETGLPLKWLVEVLEKCPSKEKLLILDTYHVGTTGRHEPQKSPREMLQSLSSMMKTIRAIAAREDSQLGQEWIEKSHGSFAWQLAQGFKGAADKNRDLHLDADEVFQYLNETLPELSFDKSTPQTPHLFPE